MALSVDPVNTLSGLESSCRRLRKTKSNVSQVAVTLFYIFLAP
jgi:hypothetical protein